MQHIHFYSSNVGIHRAYLMIFYMNDEIGIYSCICFNNWKGYVNINAFLFLQEIYTF
jgi:hypothetical protein